MSVAFLQLPNVPVSLSLRAVLPETDSARGGAAIPSVSENLRERQVLFMALFLRGDLLCGTLLHSTKNTRVSDLNLHVRSWLRVDCDRICICPLVCVTVVPSGRA